jgi:hypothetical protein
MKKTFILCSLVLFGFAAHALGASDFTALAPIPGLTDSGSATSVIDSQSLASFFNNLYKYLIGLAAALAVIMIIWGGFQYSANTDSIGNKEEGKERIRNAIFGLVLVLSPVLVFSIINPSILNLSLNLPPIDLTTNAGGGSTLTPPEQSPAIVAARAAGCTISGGSLLQTATCPTQPAAQAFADACSSSGGNGRLVPTVTSNYVATCDKPSIACTKAPNSGPYLETAACASKSDAQAYRCSNGLTPQIPSCKREDQSGTCLDPSVMVYCTGKTLDIFVYQYYKSTVLAPLGQVVGEPSFVPRDAPMANSFTVACGSNGGVPKSNYPLSSFGVRQSITIKTSPSEKESCTYADYGSISVDRNQYAGVVCYGDTLSCNPP